SISPSRLERRARPDEFVEAVGGDDFLVQAVKEISPGERELPAIGGRPAEAKIRHGKAFGRRVGPFADVAERKVEFEIRGQAGVKAGAEEMARVVGLGVAVRDVARVGRLDEIEVEVAMAEFQKQPLDGLI